MLGPFKFNDIKFYKKNNKYYLFIFSNYYGKLRFGDFVMISNLLYIAKQELINQYDFISQDNLFFVIDYNHNEYIKDFISLVALFNNLYDISININSITDDDIANFNIDQLYSNGSLWKLKVYLSNINFHLDDKIPPLININTEKYIIDKTAVYILPTLNKDYNTERNWDIDFLIRIIKSIDENVLIKIISIDNYKLDFKSIVQIVKHRKKNIKILNNVSWFDIIKGMAVTCNEFIGGDCGMSHFLSAMKDPIKPNIIKCYYRTNSIINDTNIYDIVTVPEMVSDVVDFKPYSLFSSNVQILDF